MRSRKATSRTVISCSRVILVHLGLNETLTEVTEITLALLFMLFIDGHSIILINFIALQSTLIMGSRMKYFLTIYRYAVQSMQFLIICWSSPNWTKWSAMVPGVPSEDGENWG